MRKRASVLLLVVACLAGAPSAASAAPASPPRAHSAQIGTAIAGAFASKLALTGAGYLTKHLQSGALGDTGKNIGNLLATVGLADPSPAEILGEIQGLRAQLDATHAKVTEVASQLDKINEAVASGFYSTNVQFLNSIRGAVITGLQKLRQIAELPPGADRTAVVADLIKLYDRDLRDKFAEVELRLTGGAPGASGILQLASKRAQAAAQPFYVHKVSMFARDVYEDYALMQASMLTIQVNILHYERASTTRIEQAINAVKEQLDREWLSFPHGVVFRNTVLDTRTMRLWSWGANYNACDALPANATTLQINTCIYDNGHNELSVKFDPPCQWCYMHNYLPTNGGQGWARPTVAQLQQLRAGNSGAGVDWMNRTGGFPTWLRDSWATEAGATTANVVTLGNGAHSVQPRSHLYHLLMVGIEEPRYYYFLP